MSIPLVDYYSVSTKGYTKHPNIEILGIDALPTPLSLPLTKPSQSVLSVEKDFEHESVIKQQENQYEPFQPRQEKKANPPSSLSARMMERQEVTSVNLTPKCNNNHPLTYSCIANSNPQRGILKRSLMELQKKNITSQEDSNCDKQLYLQLEKERRLRKELERTYRTLLSEMQRKERSYSADLTEKEDETIGRRRQFSKRTLNYQKSNEGLYSYQELETQKDRKMNHTKTVKMSPLQKTSQNTPEQLHNNENDEQQVEDNDNQTQQSSDSRKHLITQQSGDSESDYFRDQKQFQNRVISQLRDLNKRIQQIDHFLIEKQREQQRERLESMIREKQREIKRVEEENQRLRRGIQPKQDDVELNIMKKVTPTSLYFFLILIMAIVAMS